MSDNDLFGTAAEAVYLNAQRNGLTWRLTPGTVLSSDSGLLTSISVQLDGDDNSISAQSLIGPLLIGARVMVMTVPPQGNYIIGYYGASKQVVSYIDEIVRNSSVGPFTTTETVLDEISWLASTGVRYKLTWMGTVQSTVANDLIGIRARWEVGGALSSAGTLITTREISVPTAGRGFPANIITTFVPNVDVVISAGVLALRTTGTGNISSFADANRDISLLIERA